ncbi:MAG TPA: hypothetical protein VNH44_03075, partial [Micropepsaceae bacterium]|nr:hypothetical protein [Micropepsaceae bacterium]
MAWQIELVGADTDIAELAKLAQVCDAYIGEGPDGRPCLTGANFETLSAEDVRIEAERVLKVLNSFARLRQGDHRTVKLGNASRVRPDGKTDRVVFLQGGELRLRGGTLGVKITRADGSVETDTGSHDPLAREKRIAANTQLAEIVEVFSGDVTWQRLRVAYEKIVALIGSGRKDNNALVKNGYCSVEEYQRFKANA